VQGASVVGPGPAHSVKDASLIVMPSTIAPDGFLVHSYAGDDPLECKDYIGQRLGIPSFQPSTPLLSAEALAIVVPTKPEQPPPANSNADFARKIWCESTATRGSLAERYLNSRCLILDPDEDWHRVLRFHPLAHLDLNARRQGWG
jgi:putative DNA primase/helicase